MATLSELIANDLSVIKNSLIKQVFNISVPYTQTQAPVENDNNNLVNTYQSDYAYLGNVPLLAKSVQITYDSTFLSNYKVKVVLEGLNIDNNQYNYAPANSSGFDYVPTGASFLIPAGARLKVYAFNANGASTNGTLNIIATFNRLDTYK